MFPKELTITEIEAFVAKDEGSSLDFKMDHTPERRISDLSVRLQKRGEWMKDILSFANTPRTSPAYILVGISDKKIVGIAEGKDDAFFQGLFRDCVNRMPVFRYYEVRRSDERVVGVFEIAAEQARPLYLTRTLGPTDAYVAYVRCGSMKNALPPDQMSAMFGGATTRFDVDTAIAGSHVRTLAERWLNLFERHGVLHHQIPSLLPHHFLPLPWLGHWVGVASLLSNNALIEDTCSLFNVRREWMDGDSATIYHPLPLSFKLDRFLDVLEAWRRDSRDVSILGFRDGRRPLEELRNQHCSFILRATVHAFGEKAVFKFQPCYGVFDWDYDKGRQIVKLAWLIARLAGCDFWGWKIRHDEMSALAEGFVMPAEVLTNPWEKVWQPEDFTYAFNESCVAKEVEEHAIVLEYAAKQGYIERAAGIRRFVRDD